MHGYCDLRLIQQSSDKLLSISTRHSIIPDEPRKDGTFTMSNNMPQDINIWQKTAAISAVFLVVVGAMAVIWWFTGHVGYSEKDVVQANINRGIVPPKPELLLYKPLLPEQAVLENGQLPFSSAPVESAMPLILPAAQLLPIGRRNAIDCLTSAIYYEAGNELPQGKRAVAQVILNRVRHPAFPKSICGVVYQGSERRTGCQFTFTCDGSLARRPARDRWEQARMVAIGAISGAVEPSVGMATHYHANYVLPYWAPSLDKISQIGTHIFYRWKGSWGRRRAFSQVVQLDEEALQPITVDEVLADPSDQFAIPEIPLKPPSRIIADDNLLVGPVEQNTVSKSAPAGSTIRADQARSTLTADEQKSTLKNN
jgi:hypothetical protein